MIPLIPSNPTGYGVSYAGVTLLRTTSQAAEWVARNMSTEDLNLFTPRPLQNSSPSCWPLPLVSRSGPVKLGTLFWPTGATRFAVGHFLASGEQVQQIKDQVIQNGQYTAAPLVLNSGEEAIFPDMWLLPPRPLSFDLQTSSESLYPNGLYLLTFVDDRYYWWSQYTSNLVPDGSTTWQDLIDAASMALGVTTVVDPIDPAYLVPGPSFAPFYSPAPSLLDAIAYSIGMRVVRDLGGTVYLTGPDTTLIQIRQNIQDQINHLKAGGQMFSPRWGKLDSNQVLPSQLLLLFPRDNFLDGDDPLYSVVANLVDQDLFTGSTGYPGTKVLLNSVVATFTNPTDATPTNDSGLQDLAAQFASDWYQQQLSGLDLKFSGIRYWVPEGSDDIEWTIRDGEVSTRIQRAPWNDEVTRVEITDFTGANGGPGTGGGGTVCCLSTEYTLGTDFTCSGGVRTLTTHTFDFAAGRIVRKDGSASAVCNTVTLTWVTGATCSGATFTPVTHDFTFDDGRLSHVDGTDKSCGDYSYPIIISATCTDSGALQYTTRTFTWSNGWLTGVSGETTTTINGCTACCGGSTPVIASCCSGGPQNLPNTLHVTLSANVAFSRCGCMNGTTIPITWDGSTYFTGDAAIVLGTCQGPSGQHVWVKFNPADCTMAMGCGSTPTYGAFFGGDFAGCFCSSSALSWTSTLSPNATPHATNFPPNCCYDSSGNFSPLVITVTY
jgi:hypothetical protein